MYRTIVILLFSVLASAAFAQQSNKSKSKDRYREKDQPSALEVSEAVDRLGALRALAERELRPTTFAVSDVLLRDAAGATEASRVLAYTVLSGYETTARYQSRVSSLHDVLRGMPLMLSFTPADSVFYPFASLWAMLETARQMTPSGYLLSARQDALEQAFRQNGLQEPYLRHSKAAARDISRLVLDYARVDGYDLLSLLPANATAARAEDWSPVNAEALDPNWGSLRPFFLETTQPFRSPAPTPYDPAAGSAFMQQVEEVYRTVQALTPDQRAIVYSWACDPAAAANAGMSRLTPASRWLNICGLACEQQRLSFIAALKIHTILTLSMADAVITAWADKYAYKRMRPQAVINRSFDAYWQPPLPNPPYPAFTSVHGSVSAAAAEVLSKWLGDKIPFIDNTEAVYGLQPRQYQSFRHAAEEAAWSRLYGGLQCRDAVVLGLDSGRKIGAYALQIWPGGL